MATSEQRQVFIVGGGLAGMTVAHELAKQAVPVTILEAGNRLGGKAGADYDADLGIWLDHGFHIFPAWYANVRPLLEELGIAGELVDTDTQHTITRGESEDKPGKWLTNYAVTSVGRALHNLRNTPLPWHQAMIGTYFLIDLASKWLGRRGFLDRTSVAGYFRSRWYCHEAVANFHHFLGLQASSIPSDAMSAATFQTVVRGFMQHRNILVGMLRGDLQTRFIHPFQKRLEQLGVSILFDQPIHRVETSDAHVVSLHAGVQPRIGTPLRESDPATSASERPVTEIAGHRLSAGDIFVLATPQERTRQFLDDRIYALDREGLDQHRALSGLNYLTSEPMAALHVVFKRRLPHILPWHTSMHHSRYGLSMIDISQHWPELQSRDQTVLSAIAADFKGIEGLSPERQTELILEDLLSFIRYDANGRKVIDDSDIAAVRLNSNINAPLFLNTTSAWHFRPDGPTQLRNLFVCGDYCRSQADLTSMESAVYSGKRTAQHILRALGKDWRAAEPKLFRTPPRLLLLAAKYLLMLPIAPIGLANLLQRKTAPRPADV